MKKIIPILAAAAILFCGCSAEEILQAEFNWEFRIELPANTSPDELIAVERALRAEGYNQIVFRSRYSDTMQKHLAGVKVFATRKKAKGE